MGGALTARGGSAGGNGGFIETSGHVLSVSGAAISASAPQGKAGEWLLDPYNLTIATSGASNSTSTNNVNSTDFTATGDSSVVLNTDINNVLNNGTSVTLTTAGAGTQAGNLIQNAGADITKTAGGDASLTLIANGTMALNGNITSNVGALHVNLSSGGNMTLTASTITANGGNVTMASSAGRVAIVYSGAVRSNVTTLGGGSIDINAAKGLNVTLSNISAAGTGHVNMNVTRDSTSASQDFKIHYANITTGSGNITVTANTTAGNNQTADVWNNGHIADSTFRTTTGNITVTSNFTATQNLTGTLIATVESDTHSAALAIKKSTFEVTGNSASASINISADLNGAGFTATGMSALLIGRDNPNVISNANGSVNLSGTLRNVNVTTTNASHVSEGILLIGNPSSNRVVGKNVTIDGTISTPNNPTIGLAGVRSYGYSLNITGKAVTSSGTGQPGVSMTNANGITSMVGGNISIQSLQAAAATPNVTSYAVMESTANTTIGTNATANVSLSLASGGVTNGSDTLGTVKGVNVTLNLQGGTTLGGAAGSGVISSNLLSSINTNNFSAQSSGNGTLVVANVSSIKSLNGTVTGTATHVSVAAPNGTVILSGPVVGNNVNVSGAHIVTNGTVTVNANNTHLAGGDVTLSNDVNVSGNLNVTGTNVNSTVNVTSTSGNVSLAGTTTNVTGGTVSAANGTVTIGAANGTTSVTNVTVNASTASVVGGNITTSGNLSFTANSTAVTGGDVALGGNVTNTGNLNVTGTTVNSTANVTSTGGNVSLAGTTTNVTGGSLNAANGTATIGAANGTTSVANVTVTADSVSYVGRSVSLSIDVYVSELTLAMVPMLSTATVAALTASQLAALTPAQVAAFTAAQVAALLPSQVIVFSSAQLQALLTSGGYASLSALSSQALVDRGVMAGILDITAETTLTKTQWGTVPRLPIVDKGWMQGFLEVAGRSARTSGDTVQTQEQTQDQVQESAYPALGIQLPQVQRRYERDEP